MHHIYFISLEAPDCAATIRGRYLNTVICSRWFFYMSRISLNSNESTDMHMRPIHLHPPPSPLLWKRLCMKPRSSLVHCNDSSSSLPPSFLLTPSHPHLLQFLPDNVQFSLLINQPTLQFCSCLLTHNRRLQREKVKVQQSITCIASLCVHMLEKSSKWVCPKPVYHIWQSSK